LPGFITPLIAPPRQRLKTRAGDLGWCVGLPDPRRAAGIAKTGTKRADERTTPAKSKAEFGEGHPRVFIRSIIALVIRTFCSAFNIRRVR